LKIKLLSKNIFSSDFDYIEDVKGYAISNRKKPMLVDQRDYVYTTARFSKNSSTVYWRCQKSGCNARAASLHKKITSLSGRHDHCTPEISIILPDTDSSLFVE
jgi:hypothetical protein